MKLEKHCELLKFDEELGLVMGWAIVCKEGGEDYYDLQGDHIPEDSMMKAAADFMESERTSEAMHDGDPAGTVVFAWPLTEDVAKACNLQTTRTGLLIGVRPNAAMLKRFRDGELTGFSIGGTRITDEEVTDAA